MQTIVSPVRGVSLQRCHLKIDLLSGKNPLYERAEMYHRRQFGYWVWSVGRSGVKFRRR
jgi:hypothetical protein